MADADNVLKRKLLGPTAAQVDYAVLPTLVSTLEAVVARVLGGLFKVQSSAVTETCGFTTGEELGEKTAELALCGVIGFGDNAELGLFAVDGDLRESLIDFFAGRDAPKKGDGALRGTTRIDEQICKRALDAVLTGFGQDLRDILRNPAIAVGKVTTAVSREELLQGSEAAKFLLIQLSLDLGENGRGGRLVLALPSAFIEFLESAENEDSPILNPDDQKWTDNMLALIGQTPVNLECVLHRQTRTLWEIAGLKIGDSLALDGASIDTINLEFIDSSDERRVLSIGDLGALRDVKAFRFSGKALVEGEQFQDEDATFLAASDLIQNDQL